MSEEYVNLNVRMPRRLLELIDEELRVGVYATRSEVVREAVREWLKSRGRSL
jgi:Arc/MetJ-type ribon-helix-helix transcriptional regulator